METNESTVNEQVQAPEDEATKPTTQQQEAPIDWKAEARKWEARDRKSVV